MLTTASPPVQPDPRRRHGVHALPRRLDQHALAHHERLEVPLPVVRPVLLAHAAARYLERHAGRGEPLADVRLLGGRLLARAEVAAHGRGLAVLGQQRLVYEVDAGDLGDVPLQRGIVLDAQPQRGRRLQYRLRAPQRRYGQLHRDLSPNVVFHNPFP